MTCITDAQNWNAVYSTSVAKPEGRDSGRDRRLKLKLILWESG
jgi:hypothetical protein